MNRLKFLCLIIFNYFIFLCSISWAKNSTDPADKNIAIYDTRCEAITNPVGISNMDPAFSWKLQSPQQNVIQTAYQLTIATSPEKINTPDIYNSGKIFSDKNAFVHGNYLLLKSACKYFWKIKVWTNKGSNYTESSVAYFVTALFKQQEWNGSKWIAFEVLPDSLKVFPGVHGNGNNLGNKALKRAVIPYFRKTIIINKPIINAFIFASGMGQYSLHLNGAAIDTGLLNPTWSDYTKRCYYNSYDVSALLKEGRNSIGAIVGTGFFYINRERYRKLVIAAGYPMFRMKLIINYKDGTKQEIVTDDSWKTVPSPTTFSSIYGGEDFDANKIQVGWDKTDFDDKTWKNVLTASPPGGVMQAQEEYPVHIDGEFTPVKIKNLADTASVYDFGQNISGIIQLEAKGPKNYRIKITPAELIDNNGLPDQSASGSPYFFTYTLSGNGVEKWQPLFSYYGFRYASIEIEDENGNKVSGNDKVKVISLKALHIQNASPKVGNFHCSDTLFNKIYDLILWGIRNNMSNVATDCPHREKLGWLEETHLLGPSIKYNYDIERFYNKIINDMMDAQLPNGLVPDIAPEYVVFGEGFRDSPEWGSACILVPWQIYQWYGDKHAIEKSYSMMKKYLDYLSGKADGHLLAYGLGDWFDLGPKPPGVSQLTPLGVTATGFYYYDAAILSKIAGVIGEKTDEKKYEVLAENIRNAFNNKYFNPATKVYASGSQTSYALPLYFGIVPDSARSQVFNHLTQNIASNDYALTAGDIGFRYVVQSLEQGNAYEVIYKMNNRTDVPGYGYQLKKGATALTESWQALRNVSNDHMMLGHLMEWLYGGLAGMRQQSGDIGYKNILIAPQFVDSINWVESSYNSINGPINIKWQREEKNKIKLQLVIPANTNAKIILPAIKDKIYEKNNLIKKSETKGILKISQSEDKTTTIDAGSGKFEFSFIQN